MSLFKNPIKVNWKTVLIHVAVWLIYLLINNALLFSSDVAHLYIRQMPFTFSLVAILFYTNTYAIVEPCIRHRQYVRLVLYTILLLIAYILVRYWLFYTFLPALGITTVYSQTFMMINKFLPDSLWLAMQYILFSYGYWFALYSIRLERARRQHDQQLAALQAEKSKAELAFLRAQLNPHFLYNTLNFFFADALMVSPKLADSIMALSQMLRSVSEVSHQSLVPVSQELAYIRSYLKIQQYRFGNQLHVTLCISGEEHENYLRIPPLILISLVENVFKYGDVFDPAIPATLSVTLTDDKISFASTNRKKNSRITPRVV
ncbi:sensor histidine kinase [Spirosoma sp. KNUC1025]|uniref:sensor histidine kinase n=1 Tax=Spirosoma sp. KNUC1025 TaxID=2894082 RepID=UPI003870B429|nr:histidine kinase [Spirosoma sp. KNUC1025]